MKHPKLRRSKLLIVSLAYWRWFNETIGSFTTSNRRRSRSMFIGSGCLTWLVLIWVVLFFWLFILSALAAVIGAFGLVGALLSAIGWIDELRLMLVHREPQYRLKAKATPVWKLPPPPHQRPVGHQLPPPPPPSIASGIRELATLHESGVLSDEEFTAAKAKLLG
jgi:Short C-terminal domain